MRRIRTALALIGFIVLSRGVSSANEETSVDLSGGAKMEFVWIDPGAFLMGSPSSEEGSTGDERPQHEVTISKGFYLGKYETTQGQWMSVMGNNPNLYNIEDKSAWPEDWPNMPVSQISWDDVHVFIHQLNIAAEDSLYRLPTEAEWEYACRAGTTTPFSFGFSDTAIDNTWSYFNSCPQRCYAHVVGTMKPNPWGLFDMHGNVSEWCQDWYGSYFSDPQIDPPGPSHGKYRVLRGGSFFDDTPRYGGLRSASRRYNDGGGLSIGVRIVRLGPKATAVAPQSWGQIKDESH
jgi:formylglycine-generating enzyme required for sulfatase activity